MAQGLSPAVLEDTRRFWEERTGEPLSGQNAREAIGNISAFFDLLAQWERDAGEETTLDVEEDHGNTGR